MSDGPAPSMFTVPDPPVSVRGRRTRENLIEAARTVFEKVGFLDARLIDITTEAGCSAGTFYTYFETKEQIFAAVMDRAREEMLHPGVPHVTERDDPRAVIEASTRAYLEAYRGNARLMAVLEQVANIAPEFRRLRNDRAKAFIARNARGIAELQERGLADRTVDPELASSILSGMISRLAFSYFVADVQLGEFPRTDLDTLAETAARLWANALLIGEKS
ncbi:TetR/AcrR family transcriptional regulator [Gordonia sp. (in: high G+C Gram-positive bacteria)]|uniref:TetR/AcrR family transcriptional regulator n=1 Tax=Gordonia sp. (in: high G+C Gram-positive bacteria) TaxID=84139 RepID=UPI003C7669C6